MILGGRLMFGEFCVASRGRWVLVYLARNRWGSSLLRGVGTLLYQLRAGRAVFLIIDDCDNSGVCL